eukprot:TRINITY_DN6881_c0_g1_i1.p1 TRINITY_DN6881_c0_g1~~TRINITY_DN6881_c0_g1_i1.p1  ORF type:complete len:264 (-),score=42.53 TRINITY_DN6881_c0_g1_i1:184-975(-)
MIIQLLYSAMQVCNLEINKAISLNYFFVIIMRLFKEFIWNNFLHSLVAKIVLFVLTGSSYTLKKALIQEGELIKFLLEQSKAQFITINNKQLRSGNIPFLVKIGNELIKENYEDELATPEWQEFANNFLTPMNEKYNRFIGGQKNSGEYEDMQDLYMQQKAKEFNIVDNEIELFEQQQKNKSKEVEVIQQVPNQQNQQSLSTDIFNSFDQAFDFTAQPSQPVKVTDFDQFGFVSSQDKTNDESSNNQSNPFDQFQDFSFNQTK